MSQGLKFCLLILEGLSKLGQFLVLECFHCFYAETKAKNRLLHQTLASTAALSVDSRIFQVSTASISFVTLSPAEEKKKRSRKAHQRSEEKQTLVTDSGGMRGRWNASGDRTGIIIRRSKDWPRSHGGFHLLVEMPMKREGKEGREWMDQLLSFQVFFL